jgi:uncharacterized protein
MSLYKNWIKEAYDSEGNSLKKHWDIYMPAEQKIYEGILEQKITNISGTVEELSKRFNISMEFVCGLLDGANDVFDNKIKIEELESTTVIDVNFDFETLYRKMVEYQAVHLYNLPQWDNIFEEDKRKELYISQKKSRTVVNVMKVGRNEPCICGSGKKYKNCCGNV